MEASLLQSISACSVDFEAFFTKRSIVFDHRMTWIKKEYVLLILVLLKVLMQKKTGINIKRLKIVNFLSI